MLRVGLFAGLDQVEACFDLGEQGRELLALLRGEAGEDLVLTPQLLREQLLVQRAALLRL
ncbi:hypothetical protein XH79_04300 [Bradyrhizobium sp. CCBAU 45389]|nr:hypothetical protein [Bradyrhizobium sp. CCBAU 45389]MDA9398059.1 hypothetical protein [Bradyrhizobium sp. CCBAU 45389]